MRHAPIHILIVFGTRPEAIKLAPVIREIQRCRKHFRMTVCATGQHDELFDQVARLFRIPVRHNLHVMTRDQRLDGLTARTLVRLSDLLRRLRPGWVVVQGDTTTAFVATLAAFYQHIRVAHVEAGLRTQDRFAPFPEEINRRLISHMADLHFAPTAWARANLIREAIPAERIFVTGNTVLDAVQEVRRWVVQHPPHIPDLDGLDFSRRRLILVTAHRRESFGRGLDGICSALRDLATTRDDVEIVYPVHPNPNVRGPVYRSLGGLPRIHLIKPLEYIPFVWLMSKAYLVLTDSGGIQEEMPSLHRPVLVMREKTERPEGIRAGVCRLVGTQPDTIKKTVLQLLDNKAAYRKFGSRRNPFGDGKAATRIVRCLRKFSRVPSP